MYNLNKPFPRFITQRFINDKIIFFKLENENKENITNRRGHYLIETIRELKKSLSKTRNFFSYHQINECISFINENIVNCSDN